MHGQRDHGGKELRKFPLGRIRLTLLGDVCHHPLHFSHPDWVSAFDTDPGITPRTRAWLFKLAVERDALLVCPHAPSPGAGRLRQSGGSYAWQALNQQQGEQR